MSLTIDLPELIRLKYLGTKHTARSKQLHNQLSETQHLCDLALRIAYSSSRYGGSGIDEAVTGRSGTEDKVENLRRFENMDADFEHLNNDPGGKPYSGDQALGYAARLLVERADQLAAIIEPGKTRTEQRKLYLELCYQILTEDVRRMKKGLNVTRLRRRIMRTLGVLPALILPREAGSLIDASAVGQDASEVIKSRSSDSDEEY